MGKKLSEMSLEELWQLFPIILTKHQEDWKEWYLEEESLLKNILPQVEKISHIGSTAIPAIWAKPIIDILVEVPKESNLLDYKALLENNGYPSEAVTTRQNEDKAVCSFCSIYAYKSLLLRRKIPKNRGCGFLYSPRSDN